MKIMKCLSKVMLIISMFVLSGCKSKEENLIKELNRMEEIIVEEKLFNDDYSFSIFTDSYDKKNSFSISKDSESYYISFIEEDKNIQSWILKDNNCYYAYINNTDDKFYIDLNTDNDYVALKNVIERIGIQDINFYLKDVYTSVRTNINNLLETCSSEESKSVCQIEKKLFSKIEFTIKSPLSDDSNVEISFSFKKGKLINMKYEFRKDDIVSQTNWEFDYGSQKIDFNNKSEYKKISN